MAVTAVAEQPSRVDVAEARGDRWHHRGLGLIAVAIVFAVFDLNTFMWVAVTLAIFCSREAADHYGWRRGYLDRIGDEQARGGGRG